MLRAAGYAQLCLKHQSVVCSGGPRPFADARPAPTPENGLPRSPIAPARKAAAAASPAPAQVDSAAAVSREEPAGPNSAQPVPLPGSSDGLQLSNGDLAAAEAAAKHDVASEKQDTAAGPHQGGHAARPSGQAPGQSEAAQPAKAPAGARPAAEPQSARQPGEAKGKPTQPPKPAASAPTSNAPTVAATAAAAAADAAPADAAVSVEAPASASGVQEAAAAAPPNPAPAGAGQANGKRKVLDDSDSDDSEDDIPLAQRIKVRRVAQTLHIQRAP